MFFKELRPGQTVEKNTIYSFQSDIKAQEYLYLIAGVHGDEVEGVYVLEQLFEWLKSDEAPNIPVVVVPILNIDGYRASNRVNGNGVDLNRNLPTKCWTSEMRDEKYNPGPKPLSEPENKYLADLFKKFKPKFIVSFHSWKRFINTNGPCMKEAKILQEYNKYEIIDGEIENHPTPGSLGEYAPTDFQSPTLTLEFPQISEEDISLQDIWLENEEGLKKLVKSIV